MRLFLFTFMNHGGLFQIILKQTPQIAPPSGMVGARWVRGKEGGPACLFDCLLACLLAYLLDCFCLLLPAFIESSPLSKYPLPLSLSLFRMPFAWVHT